MFPTETPMVLRIVFKSGRVAEERGTEWSVVALFEGDSEDLIDYIMALEIASTECHIYCAEEDDRFENAEILFTDDLLPKK